MAARQALCRLGPACRGHRHPGSGQPHLRAPQRRRPSSQPLLQRLPAALEPRPVPDSQRFVGQAATGGWSARPRHASATNARRIRRWQGPARFPNWFTSWERSPTSVRPSRTRTPSLPLARDRQDLRTRNARDEHRSTEVPSGCACGAGSPPTGATGRPIPATWSWEAERVSGIASTPAEMSPEARASITPLKTNTSYFRLCFFIR